MSDEKIEEIVKEYSEFAKDKNIDAATLMINALQQQDQNRVNQKAKRWAYLVSIGLPPLGYGCALWYYFKEESDAKSTAYICAGLTTLSLILSYLFLKVFLSSAGTSLEEIQQINPQDIYELTQ